MKTEALVDDRSHEGRKKWREVLQFTFTTPGHNEGPFAECWYNESKNSRSVHFMYIKGFRFKE